MKNIEKEIIETYESYNKRLENDLKEEKESREKGLYNHFEWIIERHLTRTNFEKWKNNEITTDEAIEKALKRKAKQNEKELAKKLEYLKEIEKSGNFTRINIIVEWVKSKTWGYNPHTTAEIWSNDNGLFQYESFTGCASGCGYDKQSAAIAEALNQSKTVLKAFCEYKEKALKKNKKIDKDGGCCTGLDNRDAICYGFGYSAIPSFEGGTGTNCFLQGFKLLGCEVAETHGNASDCYIITRKLKNK